MPLSLNISHWQAMLQRASPAEFWFYVIVAGGLALAAFYYAFVFFKRALVIEDTPTSRIRSAAQGYVELQGWGEQMDGPPIVAPFSNIPTQYLLTIEGQQKWYGQ